jgi:hypothetical protein
MPFEASQADTRTMPRFMLVHTHRHDECRVAFAAWRGFDSPLRHGVTVASCAGTAGGTGAHRIWWSVDAPDEHAAFAQLPQWVADRTVIEGVSEVVIP